MNPLVDIFKKEKRWVNYRIEERNGKKTKLPFSPLTGMLASSTEPSDWTTYEKARDMSNNVGIVFTADQKLLGIDIDHCLNNHKEIIHEQKKEIETLIKEANTYCEISPSGEGLHLFLRLTEALPLVANRHAPYEAYTSGRYFTFTDNPFGKEKKVKEVSAETALSLLKIIGYPWGKDKAEEEKVETSRSRVLGVISQTLSLDDATILQRMFSARNGSPIKALYNADTSSHNNDYSATEMAFCSHLAFWTGKNADQMERIWLASPLGSRLKTSERQDYRTRTIEQAIKKCKEVYTVSSIDGVIVNENEEEAGLLRDFLKEKIKSTFHLAEYLTRQFNIITIGEKEREMYVYRDGIYFQAENEIIFPEIQRILGNHTTKHAKNETFHKIADMTSYPRDVFTTAPIELIPLDNGVYNIKTKELLPHSPEYRFTYKFPVQYDAEAKCPKTIKFLEQVLTDDQLLTVKQWLGYYFYRLYLFKKAIIFVGEGDTGKTTLLEVIANLLGSKNISSVSLQKMTGDKFAAAHLYEKHGNLVDELSANDVKDTGNFKIATGGGRISGEYKFGNQFSFINYSKFTFACNKIPDVKDVDDSAYFGRWIVIRFEKVIVKKIANFIAQLTTKEEQSGLFNYAMDGLEDLLAGGGFAYAKTAIDTKTEMMRSGSSIAVFVTEGITHEQEVEVSKADMYDAYSAFCLAKGLATETMDMFGKKFTSYAVYVAEGQGWDNSGGRGKKVRVWRNAKVKPTPAKIEADDKAEQDFNNIK